MKNFTTALAFITTICLPLTGFCWNPASYSNAYFQMPVKVGEDDYKAKSVIFKVKDMYRPYTSQYGVQVSWLNNYLSTLDASSLEKLFPNHARPEKERNPQGLAYADISLIYELNYTADVSVEEVVNRLYATGILEYAQPYYLPKTMLSPNDPFLGSHLGWINAYSGWDVSTGDPNTIIGVVDTGIDMNHADLNDDIAPGGWDFVGNDNNPQATADHGVHVSGLAAAETNNATGVAAPGFDCRILPVRAGTATTIQYGYQGIQYCADNGADIINCSWGGAGGGPFGQDIVTYATINKDALVVAAAGNGGTEEDLYPASYTYVISVVNLSNATQVNAGSSYGFNVDVCAPGTNLYSTILGNQYGFMTGTSMASPVAAGCAALIKSNWPSWTALQVGEQLKATAVNIYGSNPAFYTNKLGKGRVNLGAAMAGMAGPSVLWANQVFTDNNDNTFVVGDTIRISAEFTNYLSASGSITATLTENSPFVTVLDGNSALGVINTLQTVNNTADPFTMRINTGTPLNHVVSCTLNLTDGSYSTNFYFNITVNVDYINIAINQVGTTITSKNGIGYNQDGQLEGLGFEYPLGQTSLMYDASLMLGVSGKVSDHARDPQTQTNNDFSSIQNVSKIPNVFSEYDIEGWFNDDGAGGSKLDVDVHQHAYAWGTVPGHDKYVIFEYRIYNTGASALSNFYAGIFVDWDIMDYLQNRCNQNASKKLGYSYSTQASGLYAGTRLLTPGTFVHYGIDNDGSGGSVNIYQSYSTAEKFTTLSTQRATAGQGDVSDVVSSGPHTISPGDSLIVAFALIAGDDLADLEESSDSAQAMYNTGGFVGAAQQQAPALRFHAYPNPAQGQATVQLQLPEASSVALQVHDATGRAVRSFAEEQLPAGMHYYHLNLQGLAEGLYILHLQVNGRAHTRKITVSR